MNNKTITQIILSFFYCGFIIYFCGTSCSTHNHSSTIPIIEWNIGSRVWSLILFFYLYLFFKNIIHKFFVIRIFLFYFVFSFLIGEFNLNKWEIFHRFLYCMIIFTNLINFKEK